MKRKTKIIAPSEICLYTENPQSTILFLQNLHIASHLYRVVEIDFSHTEKVTTLASLVLLSHLHYIQLYKKNKKAIVLNCEKSPVYQSFFENTLFRKAVESGCYETNGKTSVVFPFKAYSAFSIAECRNMLADYVKGFKDELKAVLSELHSESDINQFFSDLLLTMTELLQNISHHAYPVDRNPFVSPHNKLLTETDLYKLKLFWCMLWYDDREQRIVFALYDFGTGLINSYLHFSELPDYELNRLAKLTKKQIFQELLEAGNSRFFGSGRGNGLDAVFNTSMKLSDISLMLLSEDIRCERTFIGNQYSLFSCSLPGTAVEWNFKFRK
ncbi:hypothetical protein [Glaesserella parasuis]|uniref:Uncharacterized protein n=2 Tax=Glaesserella parasuis TaxID=738 RepID=A0AAJ6AEN6_GLAPU|nr:hypothetical protein [Glaesserella parasuis]MCT8574615.1 hypothetical protein [Glaesserella parasuis]MCT8655348.1 hypothetical protein [Glaesserella parasuis]MCT8836482.1 hypothetical protein [Glaesserella parasuis]MDG6360805.1 hypothetical protein [Glaesserella parasuis]MDG6409289.1 hypothetical protein [Glaesserella parasuis]